MKFKVVWDIAPFSHFEVALVMEAVRTSETSVHFNVTTRRYIQKTVKLMYRLFIKASTTVFFQIHRYVSFLNNGVTRKKTIIIESLTI
jgi:hypothetical protein